MFKVRDKQFQIFMVYKVQNNKNGYPMFLIYDCNQWLWKSAKHFAPVEENNYVGYVNYPSISLTCMADTQ